MAPIKLEGSTLRINKTSFYSKTIYLERRQLIHPSVTPSYTSIREHLRSSVIFIFSLLFSPLSFPSSCLTLLLHRAQGARSPRALIFHEARPKETDLSFSYVTELYTSLSRKGNSCGRNVRDAVCHPSFDITSFRLLHRID